jgi:hypothetical protein
VSTLAPPALPVPSTHARDLVSRLLEAERDVWQRRNVGPLVSLFAPSATITFGRGSEPGPHDVTHTLRDWSQLLVWQLFGRLPNADDTSVAHEATIVREREGRLEVELTRVIRSMLVQERVKERFELAEHDGEWRVTRLRGWPLQVQSTSTTVEYGPERWQKLDVDADAIAPSDPRQKAEACFEALRYAESVRWYDTLVRSAAVTPRDWLALGWTAAFAGQMERSKAAFRRAEELDPTQLVPEGEPPEFPGDGSK